MRKSIYQATALCIPSKVITDVGRFKPLWMNKQALRKAKKRYHAWIPYINTKSGEHYQNYIRARNESSHESRRARKDFERKLAAETKTNNKGFLNYVDSRRKPRTNTADLRTNQGALSSDDLENMTLSTSNMQILLQLGREITDGNQLFKITHGFDTVSISSTCPICNKSMFKPSLATQTRGHPYTF